MKLLINCVCVATSGTHLLIQAWREVQQHYAGMALHSGRGGTVCILERAHRCSDALHLLRSRAGEQTLNMKCSCSWWSARMFALPIDSGVKTENVLLLYVSSTNKRRLKVKCVWFLQRDNNLTHETNWTEKFCSMFIFMSEATRWWWCYVSGCPFVFPRLLLVCYLESNWLNVGL